MNDMIDTTSDLRNLITVDFTETMTPDIELTESELEAMDDIRVQDELTATVAELPAPTEEMVARYNEKMEFLASIRADLLDGMTMCTLWVLSKKSNNKSLTVTI